jgi:hypothetical protein
MASAIAYAQMIFADGMGHEPAWALVSTTTDSARRLPISLAHRGGETFGHADRSWQCDAGRAFCDWLRSLPADFLERFRLRADIEAKQNARPAAAKKAVPPPSRLR